MVQFNVDSGQVAHGALAARQHGEAIRHEVQAMTVLLTNLEGAWTGGASAAFQGVLQEWRTAQQHVESALASMAQALAGAARQYEEAETSNLGMFGR